MQSLICFQLSENQTALLQDAAMYILAKDECRELWSAHGPFQTALDNEMCYYPVDENHNSYCVSTDTHSSYLIT